MSSAQSVSYAGIYQVRHETTKGDVIEYNLTLKQDGTFMFHAYSHMVCSSCNEENNYGKGIWKPQKKNLIFFYTNHKNDMDESHTLNFTNTKARFISKSPRDKSDRIIKTALKFYESDILWVTGKELFKLPITN